MVYFDLSDIFVFFCPLFILGITINFKKNNYYHCFFFLILYLFSCYCGDCKDEKIKKDRITREKRNDLLRQIKTNRDSPLLNLGLVYRYGKSYKYRNIEKAIEIYTKALLLDYYDDEYGFEAISCLSNVEDEYLRKVFDIYTDILLNKKVKNKLLVKYILNEIQFYNKNGIYTTKETCEKLYEMYNDEYDMKKPEFVLINI